jgi:hypothetical protein
MSPANPASPFTMLLHVLTPTSPPFAHRALGDNWRVSPTQNKITDQCNNDTQLHHPRMHIKLHLCSVSELLTQNNLPISNLLLVECNCQSLFVLRSHNNTLQLLLYIHNWQITSRNTSVSFPRKPFTTSDIGLHQPQTLLLSHSLYLLFQPKHQPEGAGGGMERAQTNFHVFTHHQHFSSCHTQHTVISKQT